MIIQNTQLRVSALYVSSTFDIQIGVKSGKSSIEQIFSFQITKTKASIQN